MSQYKIVYAFNRIILFFLIFFYYSINIDNLYLELNKIITQNINIMLIYFFTVKQFLGKKRLKI